MTDEEKIEIAAETLVEKITSNLTEDIHTRLLQANIRIGFHGGVRYRDKNPNEKVMALVKALEFYANKERWNEFISRGNIFEEQDGDFVDAFDRDQDAPYLKAINALASFRDSESK